MKNAFVQFSLALSKIQKQHIQLIIILIALAVLVLGAGAPDGSGPF